MRFFHLSAEWFRLISAPLHPELRSETLTIDVEAVIVWDRYPVGIVIEREAVPDPGRRKRHSTKHRAVMALGDILCISSARPPTYQSRGYGDTHANPQHGQVF